jgi:hypothetical protein
MERLIQLVSRNLVCLGQNNRIWDLVMVHPLFHHLVRVRGRHPAIHEYYSQLQLFPIQEVAFDHAAKGLLHSAWRLRVSIAGQIHKIHALVDKKEVDRLRPAGRRTRSSQSTGIRESVQQTGFANIRSPTKSDLRSQISGKLFPSRCTLDESGGTDFHDWRSRGRNRLSL